jgi:hypothetical protein
MPKFVENFGQMLIFQLDSAPPHCQHSVNYFLNEKVPDRWIARGGPTA